MRVKTLFITLLMAPTIANAGPFGIEIGQSLKSLKILENSFPGLYTVSVPQPNGSFEGYSVIATPQDGVCKITAMGTDMRNDEYGTSARMRFEGLRTALSAKYGSNKFYDRLDSGSIWKYPKEWATALSKKERTLTAFWNKQYQSTMPSGIDFITLDTKSVNGSTTYVNVVYEGYNFDSCLKHIQAVDGRAL